MPPQTAQPPPQENITIVTDLYSCPQYAEQLGHLCVIWARLEWNMYQLFQAMCGAPPTIARSIFYAVESNRGRRDIVNAVGRFAVERPGDRSELERLVDRIGTCGKQRNKYVHDTWGVAQTQKHEVFQLRLSNPDTDRDMEEITVKDLQNTTEHVQRLCDDMNAFREKILSSLPSSLQKLRERPGIALQFAKKGHPPGRKPKGFHGRR